MSEQVAMNDASFENFGDSLFVDEITEDAKLVMRMQTYCFLKEVVFNDMDAAFHRNFSSLKPYSAFLHDSQRTYEVLNDETFSKEVFLKPSNHKKTCTFCSVFCPSSCGFCDDSMKTKQSFLDDSGNCLPPGSSFLNFSMSTKLNIDKAQDENLMINICLKRSHILRYWWNVKLLRKVTHKLVAQVQVNSNLDLLRMISAYPVSLFCEPKVFLSTICSFGAEKTDLELFEMLKHLVPMKCLLKIVEKLGICTAGKILESTTKQLSVRKIALKSERNRGIHKRKLASKSNIPIRLSDVFDITFFEDLKKRRKLIIPDTELNDNTTSPKRFELIIKKLSPHRTINCIGNPVYLFL